MLVARRSGSGGGPRAHGVAPVAQDIADAELRDKQNASGTAAEERASSGHQPSAAAAAMSSEREGGAAASPPRMQLMDRDLSLDGAGMAADPDRIPAAVFERDDPSEPNKDWSMMSTESVFGLQVAPSSDFTGFFLAHPELMDIATPPRSSMVASPPRTSVVDADAKAAPVISPPFDSIPELPENTMKGNYSFAFPKYAHLAIPLLLCNTDVLRFKARFFSADERNLIVQLDRGQEELLQEDSAGGGAARGSGANGTSRGGASCSTSGRGDEEAAKQQEGGSSGAGGRKGRLVLVLPLLLIKEKNAMSKPKWHDVACVNGLLGAM